MKRYKPHKWTRRIVYFLLAIGVMLLLPQYQDSHSTSAITCSTVQECQIKKAALEQEKNNYQSEISKLELATSSLKNELAKLEAEASAIQLQVDIYQASYDQLTIQIIETEKNIVDNQNGLGEILANMYVSGQITPIEMIASSRNISEFMDKQEYQSSIRDQLTETISQIKQLRSNLGKQRLEVEQILGSQKNAKRVLDEKLAEQQRVINETQGQESLYQNMSKINDDNLKELAIIERSLASTNGTLIVDPSKGNYPWGGYGCWIDGFMDSHAGPNGNGRDDLGYDCRQCVSYAAWKILERTGVGYSYWGNAKYWANSAANVGFQVDTSASAHSVGVRTRGTWGHVVWVETDPDVNGNIIISQYNSYYDNTGDDTGPGLGNYSKKTVGASEYNYYIHIP